MVGEQGFPSKPRAALEGGLLEGTDETEASRAAELRAGVLNLGLAWGLVALCCTHHAGHLLHGTGLHEVTGSRSGSGGGYGCLVSGSDQGQCEGQMRPWTTSSSKTMPFCSRPPPQQRTGFFQMWKALWHSGTTLLS